MPGSSSSPLDRQAVYPGSELVLERLPLGIVFQDARGEIAAANAAAERILGLTLEQLRGARSVDARWDARREDGTPFPGEAHPAMEALRTGEPVRDVVMDVRIAERNERVWIRVSAFPSRADDDGPIIGVYAVFEDISAQKRAQEEKAASEARFQAVFSAMAEGMALHELIYDSAGLPRDYRILDVNPAFAAQTGLARESVVGQLASVAYGTGSAPFLHCYAQVTQTGRPQVFEQYFTPLQRHFRIRVFSPGPGLFATVFEDVTERKQAEAALHESNERLRLLGDNLPNSAVYQYLHEPDGRVRFLYVSAGIERLNGVSAEEVLRDAAALHGQIPAEFLGRLVELEARSKRELSDFGLEVPMRRPDGEVRWMRLHSRPRRLPDGRILWDGVQIDVTDRKAAEEALRRSELRYRTLVDATSAVTWSCPPSGLHIEPQPEWMAFTGQSAEEMLGAGWTRAVHPEDVAAAAERWTDAVERGEPFIHEQRIRRHDGQWRWMSVHAAPIRAADGEIREWIGMNLDVTERRAAEEQVRQLAFYDPLTGLPNRRLLEERLRTALAQMQRQGDCLAVMALDLDHFKAINDALGHGVGDALLTEVARRMAGSVRASDTVARLGGDEFMLLLPGVKADGAAHLAAKLVDCLGEPMRLDGHALAVTASLGVSLSPRDGTAASQLIHRADTAMYRAKQAGRNRYQFFTEDMQREALRIMTLEHQLRQALGGGELCLHYQPQVALEDGRAIGLEALVRWRHPARGLLGADQFVPLAETSGLILDLGAWVLRAVGRQLQGWARAGLPLLPVAINLSGQQFRHRERRAALSAQVRALLADGGLTPALLELEMTENSLLEETEETLATLQELRALGVRLTLDDFGTGYSSLSTLNAFPVDRLKIDQSFVHAAPHLPKQAAIVETILALGRHLELEVVAEGVETAAQLEQLRRQGCRQGQGYYFSRPLPAEAVEPWLRGPAESAGDPPLPS